MLCNFIKIALRTPFEQIFRRTPLDGCFWTITFSNIEANRLFTYTAWKVSKYGVISGPYFPVFGLNKEIYEVNLRIQSEWRKIRTRNNSVFGNFPPSDRDPDSMIDKLKSETEFIGNTSELYFKNGNTLESRNYTKCHNSTSIADQ